MTGYGYTPHEHNAQARRKRQFTGASIFVFSGAMLVMFTFALPHVASPPVGPVVVLMAIREPAVQFFPIPTFYGALLAATGWKWLYNLGQFVVAMAMSACLLFLVYVAFA